MLKLFGSFIISCSLSLVSPCAAFCAFPLEFSCRIFPQSRVCVCDVCMHVTCLTSHFLPYKPDAGFCLNLALGRFNGNSFETFLRKSVHRLPVHPKKPKKKQKESLCIKNKGIFICAYIQASRCVSFSAPDRAASTASILFYSAASQYEANSV